MNYFISMKNIYRSGGKRIFDFVTALLLLSLLWPLMLVCAIIVALVLGPPVFFRQHRPGLHGTPFCLIKFRTMRDLRNTNGDLLSDNDRQTALGRFLRSTSLDELPELINVLKGEMSLVGPRPLLMHYLERYSDLQKRRHDVRPGITGLAQVEGRNRVEWHQRFEKDLLYIQSYNFMMDVRILVLTLFKVCIRDGIDPLNGGMMTEFQGKSSTSRSKQ